MCGGLPGGLRIAYRRNMADSRKRRGKAEGGATPEPGGFLFRGDESPGVTRTELVRPVPDLTRDERAVLVALCAPILMADTMTPPAALGDIAGETGLEGADVEMLLRGLAEKFGVGDQTQLAIEAVRRGAVGLNDVSR